MNISKLTTKNQATVPKAIRFLLHLKPGDTIFYDIQPDQSILLKKATPLDIEHLKSLETTLSEWRSKDDEQAYNDL